MVLFFLGALHNIIRPLAAFWTQTNQYWLCGIGYKVKYGNFSSFLLRSAVCRGVSLQAATTNQWQDTFSKHQTLNPFSPFSPGKQGWQVVMFMFGVKVRGAESNPGNLNGVQGSNCFPRQDNILHFRCMENFSLSDFLPQQKNTNRTNWHSNQNKISKTKSPTEAPICCSCSCRTAVLAKSWSYQHNTS